jgi:dihydroflavonol-4-reductase
MEGVDSVFHAAAWMGGEGQGGRLYAVTVEGTRHLLAAARAARVPKVVHTSSVAALGVPETEGPGALLDERHTWNYRPDHYPYGYAKYLAELEVQKAVAQGQEVVIVNPTLVFGAGDLHRQSGSIILQVAEGRLKVGIEGGINCVHIEDVVAGHLAALEKGRCGERYILGGENLEHMQLLRIIAEETGVNPPNQVLPTRLIRSLALPANVLRSFLNLPISADLLRLAGRHFFYDTSKAARDLGLAEPRTVRQAIHDAYAWFRQL